MPQRAKASLTHFVAEPGTAQRGCDYPACRGHGEYRAPKSRDRLNEYYWFCLDHVRAYNKAWDYFADMSEAEIDAHIRRAAVWDRPTWSPGKDAFSQVYEEVRRTVFEDFAAFEEEAASRAQAERERERWRQHTPTPELEALACLDLEPPVDFAAVKARYRKLAKKHHPDINGGCKKAEEKLKLINRAYTVLKAAYVEEAVPR